MDFTHLSNSILVFRRMADSHSQAIIERLTMSDAILQAGIQGVQGGMDQFGRAAGQIASSITTNAAEKNGSVVDSLVDIKQAQIRVEASAKVISVADSMIGALLDEIA